MTYRHDHSSTIHPRIYQKETSVDSAAASRNATEKADDNVAASSNVAKKPCESAASRNAAEKAH